MDKRLFIGVDEAGYGPNLGPLLICGAAMLVPNNMTEADLCVGLGNLFRAESWKFGCSHVPLGDSKKLYQPSSGLDTLEIGLLACTNLVHTQPTVEIGQLQQLIDVTQIATQEITGVYSDLPWYQELTRFPVPRNAELAGEISRLSELAEETFAELGVELVELGSVIVAEPHFNTAISHSGSKGQLLSQTTLRLVALWIEKYRELPVEVYCDRQGGRKNYMPVLLDVMPEHWFFETQSSASRCSYHRQAPPHCDIHFSVGGDQFPPTGLASMLAKYLRERLMESVNAFWMPKVPGLKPTAGYPQDAKRFRAQSKISPSNSN
ncbi:MAG: hypothetical protein R3C53_04145 [Pirellulaceae bacterium]